MEVSPAMGNGQSQQEALSSPTERPVEVTAVSMEQLGTVGASELQDGVQDITECVSTIEDVAMERSDGANGDKQQRNGVVQQELQVNSALESTQETEMGTGETVEGQEDVAKKDEGSDEQKEQNGVVPNGYVDLEQRDQEKRAEQELKPVSGLAETTVNSGGVSGQKENAAVEAAVEDAQRSAASTPSPAVHVADVDMVFPDDEVPIELCPFSSDGSIDPPRVQRPAGNTRVAPQVDLSPGTNVATPVTKLEETTPITPASVTADEPTPQTNGNRTAGRRKRRKKLSFSARKMSSAKVKQDQANAPSSPFIDDKLRISVNGHSAENESKVDENGNAPPSPVYPDADASHLYPSNPEGAPWRWEDCDPYFAPLVHSDLDNLVRWRRECANVIAANPSAWRGLSALT
ncbi:hypothetical protein PHYBOEH_000030 [Phytophthora boehmeriae]|uniref:Uncharacterized protein n=1 Tax=Phytophthora boehmeriae TaxID=109152 RepID=A0A8T1X805_9STRA|nr:hypothetical protein PHYBOEH_000030 [Phytophthora boehmeriae]